MLTSQLGSRTQELTADLYQVLYEAYEKLACSYNDFLAGLFSLSHNFVRIKEMEARWAHVLAFFAVGTISLLTIFHDVGESTLLGHFAEKCEEHAASSGLIGSFVCIIVPYFRISMFEAGALGMIFTHFIFNTCFSVFLYGTIESARSKARFFVYLFPLVSLFGQFYTLACAFPMLYCSTYVLTADPQTKSMGALKHSGSVMVSIFINLVMTTVLALMMVSDSLMHRYQYELIVLFQFIPAFGFILYPYNFIVGRQGDPEAEEKRASLAYKAYILISVAWYWYFCIYDAYKNGVQWNDIIYIEKDKGEYLARSFVIDGISVAFSLGIFINWKFGMSKLLSYLALCLILGPGASFLVQISLMGSGNLREKKKVE